MTKSCGLVFAGGSGNRFGAKKQFEDLGGERLVDRAVRHARATCDEVVLVLPEGHLWSGPPVDAVAVGGSTHAASVRNGMDLVSDDMDIVLLVAPSHPLGSTHLFRACAQAIIDGADASVPRHNIADSLKRHADGIITSTVDKSDIALAQAPSAFRADVLRAALAEGREVPEELQLIEERGGQVVFVPGEDTNLHITTPLELDMARSFLHLVDTEVPPAEGLRY